jgi:putative nucleotidyltransferase with HDIG domain
MSEPAPLLALTSSLQQGERAWLVGGAVRDAMLGRSKRYAGPLTAVTSAASSTPADYDVALASPAGQDGARRLAREVARAAGGHPFALSGEFGAWRVTGHDHSWQLDLTPLQGETLDQDLGKRDLTINAIACPLTPDGPLLAGAPIDPFDGIGDLERGRLRMVSPRSFSLDPLRTVRLARFATELGFEAETATMAAASRSAVGLAGVAPERIFAEFKRLLCAERAPEGLALLEQVGATRMVLPELVDLHGIEQSVYHHLDVHDHTMAALRATIELDRDPARWFGDRNGPRVQAVLAEPLTADLTRGQALRFGALLHDIAKPRTRGVTAEGRITFFQHDILGAEMAARILARLRASEKLIRHVAALTRHHLRLGFLVHQRPLTRRAVYEYLSTCQPVEVDVSVLSVADRVATLGRGSERAVALHLDLTRELIGDALDWRAARPAPPLRGDELAEALGIAPGPALGQLLAELAEASYAGEIGDREQALEHARAWLGARG